MEAVGDDAAGREEGTTAMGRSSLGGAKRGRPARGSGGGMELAWGQPPQQQRQGGVTTTGAASRIYRVKATGGKDRHSKVYTAKGIRDRRVRLSVPTAIQFYDLQDRLGYDQPSKAIEWLINAASGAIDKLPSLDPSSFAPNPGQAGADADTDAGKVKQQQASKSWCSSTSETSKGSELSLSRSDGRVGGSRDKEVTVASTSTQAASFTELLTGVASAGHISAAEHRQSWQPTPVSAAAADCVGIAQHGKGAQGVSTYAFSAPTASSFGNAPPIGMAPAQPFNFTSSAQMTHFSLVQNALAAASAPTGNYSLDFSMSSGFMGANRGTLQSNSQPHFSSHHHHLQELDGPSPPFLYDDHATEAAHPAPENHLTATAALQLWNGIRHSGMKEKSKN